MCVKTGAVFAFVLVIVSSLSCQTASGIVEQVGVQLEQEFGEGGGGYPEFPDDGPVGLSSFCRSMLPMGIFMQEADAEGKVFVEDTWGLGGSWMECVFEWEGNGVWCEWGIIYHEEPVSDCLTTPDPSRNRPDPEECVANDRLNGQFCGEYEGGSITGIMRLVKTEKRYVPTGGVGQYEHSQESSGSDGVMFCNVTADGTCGGTWSAGELYGTWWIEMP